MRRAEAADDNRQRGMTLVEVLVALAIMSLVAAAVLALIAQNTRFIAAAEDQMIAGMAADQEMVEALARTAQFERGDKEKELEFSGRHFKVKRTVTETGVSGLIRIDIAIRDAAGRQTLASATTIRSERDR